jgi:hypothetical protein
MLHLGARPLLTLKGFLGQQTLHYSLKKNLPFADVMQSSAGTENADCSFLSALISSVMAIVTCLIGLQYGHVIVHFQVRYLQTAIPV